MNIHICKFLSNEVNQWLNQKTYSSSTNAKNVAAPFTLPVIVGMDGGTKPIVRGKTYIATHYCSWGIVCAWLFHFHSLVPLMPRETLQKFLPSSIIIFILSS